MKRTLLATSIALLVAASSGSWAHKEAERHPERPGDSAPGHTGMADPIKLIEAYRSWLAASPMDGDRPLKLTLTVAAGLAADGIDATGELLFDPAEGQVSAAVHGLDPTHHWTLELIDNQGDGGAYADDGDIVIDAGSFTPDDQGGLELNALLAPSDFVDFQLDRAVVRRADLPAMDGIALTATLGLFERLAHSYGRTETTDEAGTALTALVAKGRRLFLEERFAGNGRTCGTCHVEGNNFTLDPDLIRGLPRHDPLFVGERNPALGKLFEDPVLLRKLGLVITNPDGFDDLATKFAPRAVQPTLALANSLVRPDPFLGVDFTGNGRTANPPERLGWGNDAGTLRDFAIRAIVQHFPRTLARRAGEDFRLPTDEELDALAAFQLSLGRQEDFDLRSLRLKSPLATTGKALFLDTGTIGEPGHKNCNACHFNGGATAALAFNPAAPGFSPVLDGSPRGANGTFGINANETPLALRLGLPRDGGFGTLPLPTGGFGNLGDVPGVGTVPVEEFATPSLVESADTPPFFHNHTEQTLEDAVAFYGSPAFQSPLSIGAPGIGPVPVAISSDPGDPEVLAIAGFLRVLNGLENIRSAISLIERAAQAPTLAGARELAALCASEAADALEVLSSGAYAKTDETGLRRARAELLHARSVVRLAGVAPSRRLLEPLLAKAGQSLRRARAELAERETLPASYRN